MSEITGRPTDQLAADVRAGIGITGPVIQRQALDALDELVARIDTLTQENERLRDEILMLQEKIESWKLVGAAKEAAEAALAEITARAEGKVVLDADAWHAMTEEVTDLRVALADTRRALGEIAGYVRAHLAGQDADPELRWALGLADEALAAGEGTGPNEEQT